MTPRSPRRISERRNELQKLSASDGPLTSSDPENNPGIDCVALQAPFQMVWTELKNIELVCETVILRSALNVGVERIVHLD